MNIAQEQYIKAMASLVAVYDLELMIANIHCAHSGYEYPLTSILHQ